MKIKIILLLVILIVVIILPSRRRRRRRGNHDTDRVYGGSTGNSSFDPAHPDYDGMHSFTRD